DASLSATLLARLTDNVDAGGRLVVEALDNAGPELFTRYESRRDPWMFFGEQRVSYKTDNGWGGATAFSVDYQLAGGESFLRLANKATYYEELRRVDLASSLVYRRPIAGGAMLSAETGVGYNPYAGDPAGSGARGAQKDGDETYARVRVVGKLWRPWLEWEIMPGFYYRWEHERPEAWGLDLRLSMIYEAFLRGRE
ncbi:MAG TPA: hypothetical protein VN317_09330, partial [Candidatus Methanoperedens sp.]|nr:hypothetical protein [Candidatus Methanoperedens sp.]